MKEKEPQLNPGDQVCTVHDIMGADWDWTPYLNVAKGRLGIVISFEEYWADFEKSHTQTWESPNRLRKIYYSDRKRSVKDGIVYPVRFYRTNDGKDQTSYSEGYIELVGKEEIARLDFLDQKIVFIFEQLRVIFAEGDHPFQPAWGYKALVVDFMFENRSTEVLRLASFLRIWLTYIDPGRASQDGIRVEPIHIDLSDGNLAGKDRLSGQVIFHVPGNTGTYGFHLELPNVSTVEKVIELPALQPGDKVRLKRSTCKVWADGVPLHKTLYVWLAKDSIGMIVSFSQYRKYLNHLKHGGEIAPADQELYEGFWSSLKEWIETRGCFSDEGYAYLVKLEKVNRSSDDHYPGEDYARLLREYPDRQEPPVEEGEIVFVSSLDLEKI